MIRDNRRKIFLVELLNQRKDKARITLQLLYQIIAARSNEFRSLYLAEHSAIFKCIADLFVQFIAIRQDYDCRRATCTTTNLLRQEEHGVTFATPLCMPKHAKLSIAKLTVLVSLERFVYT